MKLLTEYKCITCGYEILFESVYRQSNDKYGLLLCPICQEKFKDNKSTEEARQLYAALKMRNVPVELEVYDGHKTIDMVIKSLFLNIEVDGSQHNLSKDQALSDLKRINFSFQKGYHTIRIPNCLVHDYLEETADLIVEILEKKKESILSEERYSFLEKKNKELEELVTHFLVQFNMVFSTDWSYSQSIIANDLKGYSSLFDYPEGANWENRDEMVRSFENLLSYMKDKNIFNRVLKASGSPTQREALFMDEHTI